MFENSDDYDFAPTGSSKLASLFDGSLLPSDNSNSLKYTAPKQPKVKKEVDLNDSTKSKTQTSVILAKVINLWRLEDKDYKPMGKHGLALIGSTELNLFEIISYKEKNNVILRTKVNDTFSFYTQKDCFASFYDNDNQNWLVKFETTDDQTTFCEKIQNHGASIVNNTNAPTKQAVVKPEVLPREKLPRKSTGDIDEQNFDSSGSVKRANILSRMAKMGQQILPGNTLKNPSTDISDSELDDSNDHKVPPRRMKRAIPFPIEQNNIESPVTQTQTGLNYATPVTHPHMLVLPQQSVGGLVSAYPAPNTVSPILYNQPSLYDGFHQHVLTQNTELKINLAQINAKLDSVLSAGERSGKSDDGGLKSKIKTLELRSENLLTELERYQARYDALQRKCKSLEDKSVVYEQRKDVVEELDKRIEALRNDLEIAEAKVTDYEQLRVELERCKIEAREFETTIEAQKAKLNDLELFYEANKENEELQTTVDTLNDTVTNLKLKLKDFEEHFLKTEDEKRKRIEENETVVRAFSEKIKEHMNNMYQSILSGFDDTNTYSSSQIKAQVAQNLKGTTFSLIKEFKDVYTYKSNDENMQ